METRLQKIMADAGFASRRKCEEIITAGRVTVNGEVITALGTKVSASDEILVDGMSLASVPRKKTYIMLHKPEGVVTTASDPKGRPTVMDFAPKMMDFELGTVRLFPVGRLDFDTSGLLFLTNDGDWANALMHPSHEIGKTYLAIVSGKPSEKKLQKLRDGINLNGRVTAPAEVEIRRRSPTQMQSFRLERRTANENEPVTALKIIIHEGRKRQIRRMCDAIGHPVLSLKRVAIGKILLGNLGVGKWRRLREEEIASCAKKF